MIDEILNELDISHGSVHKIIADHLKFHEICARWVPHLLTEERKEVHLHFCNVAKRKKMSFWTKL